MCSEKEPALEDIVPGRSVSCHFARELALEGLENKHRILRPLLCLSCLYPSDRLDLRAPDKTPRSFAMFHVRQSIGVFIFLAAAFTAWAVLTWVLSWIPFGFIVGIGLFTMVITVFLFEIVIWVIGIVYALQSRVVLLPVFGEIANKIHI